MPELTRTQLVLWLAAGAAVVVLGARWAGQGDGSEGAIQPVSTTGATTAGAPPGAPGSSSDGVQVSAGGRAATVHVAGAVRDPGVFRLPPGSRVQDAVRRAGGATDRADLSGLNLAAPLEDGRQVVVPERVRAGSPSSAAAGAGAAAAGAATPSAPVSLNSATPEQLDTLEGVGPGLAAAIIAYREEKGGFRSVDELDEVPGIGEGRMATLRDKVAV